MKLHKRKKKVKPKDPDILSLFLSQLTIDGYWIVSKLVTSYFQDHTRAIFLGEIVAKHNLFRTQNKLKKMEDGNWFFLTYEGIKNVTFISIEKQRKFVKEFEKIGLIDRKMMEVPAKQYYKINVKILEELSNHLRNTDLRKSEGLDIKKNARIYNKKESNNNIILPKDNINYKRNKISSKDDIRLSGESLPTSQPENPSHKDSRLLQNRKVAYPKDVERLFDFWNDRGPPLTSHRRDTKTYHNSCKKLLMALETNTLERIMTSMLNYHDLITDPSNNIAHKASIGLPGCKVNLIEFFGFDKRTKEAMKLRKINLPIKSWFDECVKNKSAALEKKFGMFIEDPYPDISDRFRKLWFKKMGVGKINATGENKIRKAAVMFNDFMDVNLDSMILGTREKRYIYELVDYVFDAIDEDVKGDWLVVTVGWLCSKRTYDIRLPLHLSRLGILEREEKEDKKDVDDGFSIY